jgi:hypothetical protein
MPWSSSHAHMPKCESTLESFIALQFQDQVAQRLGHVADELAEMRKTVDLPLELLTIETPVLGESRRKEVGERPDARYTMHAERAVLGVDSSPETKPSEASLEVGEVELF